MENYLTQKYDHLLLEPDFINNVQTLGRAATNIKAIIDRSSKEIKDKLDNFIKIKYKLIIKLDFDIESLR